MTFTQILAILRARWLAASLVFATIVGLIVGVTLWLPKQYTATATVLLDFKNADPITGQTYSGVVPMSFVVTQVDVIRSARVVQQVIERLRLRESDALRAEYAESSAASTTTFEAWLIELLRDRDRLEIRPTKDSGALSIAFSSPDPAFAAALANAFAEAYIATTVQLRNDPARQSIGFFEAQSKAAKEAYEAAQSRLSEFQQRNELVATGDRYDVEMARLQELSSQQVALQAVAAEASSRSLQARANGSQTQEVINNGLLAGLTADLTRQQARLEELGQRLGPSHPSYIDAKVAVDELQRRITEETRRVNSSVGVSSEVAQSRLAAVNAAVAEQRARVLRMKQSRDEAAVLEREVESTRLAYQNLMQRQSQLGLESRTDRSYASFIETAAPPGKPSSPKIVLNALIAVVLGAVLALAMVMVLEWRDRRFRTLDDAQEVLKIRVLGVIPKVTPVMLAKEPAGHGLVHIQAAR